uniref:Uncharacterized protein n=1 Tax=Spongospora subterranea TaxID=70186 RepID=A0A0H5RCR8_9EUKA|eukprot:CRZ11551.1 hypothetical protein [Spongospora subterranea]
MCHPHERSSLKFRVNHKNFHDIFRTVDIQSQPDIDAVWRMIMSKEYTALNCVSSYLCPFRHVNQISCSTTLFNQRWSRNFLIEDRDSASVDINGVTKNAKRENLRLIKSSALFKSLVLRSVFNQVVFNMVKSTIISLNQNVETS